MRKRFILTLLTIILLAVFPFSAYGSLDDLTVSDGSGDAPIYGPGLQGGPFVPTVETVEAITSDPPELYSNIKLRGSVTHNGNSDITSRGFEFGLTQAYGTNIDVPAPDIYSIDRTWGEAGNGNNQFSYIPFGGIVADSQGNVYVADMNNYTVQKFDQFGHFLFSIGSQGMGNGQFEFISSMATDSTDNLYVTDFQTNHARIQKFDNQGNHLLSFGSYGETNANSEFVVPRGIDVDSAGKIYVGDVAADRVQVFSSAGVYESSFGSTGNGVGLYTSIADVIIDDNDNIYITDTDRDDVQKFDSSWNHLRTYDLNENGQPFPDLWQIAVDSNENVFIYGEIWDSNGNFQGSSSNYGGYPNRIAIGPDDAAYVASDNSVFKFTPPGEIPLSWFEADLSDLDCGTEYHFRAFSTNDQGTSYGEDQTFTLPCPWDFAFDVELLNESPVVATDNVSYQFTISNLSDEDAPYMGGIYMILPMEFSFSSNSNSDVLCQDQGLAEDTGDPYIAVNYSGHHFMICIPNGSATILGNGGTLTFTIDGIASSDYVLESTSIKGIYVDPDLEPEFSDAFNSAYGTGVDFTTLSFNNVAQSVYGETQDPPETTTTTTTTTTSPLLPTTSTGTSPTTTQPNVTTTTQSIIPVEQTTTTTATTTTSPNQPTETTAPGNSSGDPVEDSNGEHTNPDDSLSILGLFSATGAFILRNIFLVIILLITGATITFIARRRKKRA